MNHVVCFANREIGARIASDLICLAGIEVVSIVTNDPPYDDFPIQPAMKDIPIVSWSRFVEAAEIDGIEFFAGLSILFRHRVPRSILSNFSRGVVNLHPSLLPFGRGSRPATWAIWQSEPYGASAHLMSEELDAGPLLGQIEIAVEPWDTSHSLYRRGVDALWDIYASRVRPWITGGDGDLVPQSGGGTMHTIEDFKRLQLYARDSVLPMGDHIRLVRALSLGPAGGLKIPQDGLVVDVQAAVHPPQSPDEELS